MIQFKTTDQIFSDMWAMEVNNFNITSNPQYWNQDRYMILEDVNVWEEIEYVPGCFGIYVSWDPYAEFYLVVFNQFLNAPNGVQIFSGKEAANNVALLAKKLGCHLNFSKILMNN